MPATSAELDSLRREVSEHRWYHTLELAPGIVTPGWFDLRGLVDEIPLPRSLEGKRCLDIGTFDGFWAFEMERRGAAEVVAIDVLDPDRWDWPAGSSREAIAAIGDRKGAGEGFELARRALGMSVKRHEMSIHELDREVLGGFDLIYIGSLLLHLRDPIGGLRSAHGVCDGDLLLVDAIDLARSRLFPRTPIATLEGVGRPWWWKPNQRALVRMVEAAGFGLSEPPQRVFMKPGPGHPPRKLRPLALRNSFGREETLRAWRGDPHAAIAARPL